MALSPTGIVVAFGTSSFTGEFTGVSLSGQERPAIDVTKLASTNYREFLPGKLVNAGTVEFSLYFDPDEIPPIAGVAETMTITWPIKPGGSTGATLAGTGFVMSWSADATGGDESAMTADVTWQWDGQTGPTFTDGT